MIDMNIWQLICVIVFLGYSAVNQSETVQKNQNNEVHLRKTISPYIAVLTEDYGFNSNDVFLKIYTSDKKVLFLGKISQVKSFSLDIPPVIDKLYFELFLKNSDDKQFKGEIVLQ